MRVSNPSDASQKQHDQKAFCCDKRQRQRQPAGLFEWLWADADGLGC
jgi:hypothetical protein